MEITPFVTENAPVSGNPLTQSLKVGDLLFVSGTGPASPKDGLVPEGIEAQTRQALDNLKTIIEEAGSGMGRVVKTTVFLKDMADARAMNRIYASYFPNLKPTRSCVEISAFGNPSWRIEIEAIAVLKRPE